jgi:hypothetical protein
MSRAVRMALGIECDACIIGQLIKVRHGVTPRRPIDNAHACNSQGLGHLCRLFVSNRGSGGMTRARA